ncbi:amino acid adenylation domain-containing protein [Micromonospora aurantiaca]|uniref:Amino acid adenylation domain-containing protein n=1 Tax=Micromonospora aurantiaca (nom. illeg.) TaxID=47850 RepID=A0A3M9JWD2_9ACTN|nr:non-ribosomal peptide synthetase [Micromonospora aurantiaca]ADL45384.1 amino acid adenylation domain protein [Micromonospora aurantiaca ATCC 27029]AXH91496.1 amino acid adenylation domain-containing protein [Micromonospora aurantiaca]RNH93055.1 amino acid adenylation domain-containing protein [Micromonospora aurantiaca]
MQPEAASWERSGMAFQVVRWTNGQLSIWPVDRELPADWTPTGHQGTYATCLKQAEALGSTSAEPVAECMDSSTCDHPNLLTLFADSVARHGGRPAVSDAVRSLTYVQLDQASDAMAAALVGRGVQREDRVAVFLPRGVDVIIALLATLKAGGAYVPIDARLPDSRRDLMIKNSGARLVITTPGPQDGLAGLEAIAPLPPDLTGESPDHLPATSVMGCQAACVLFTSGSSGTPKAIVLEHRNLAYFAVNPALPQILPQDRVGHVSSLSFDAFNFEVWCSLAAGAEIVVLPTMPDLIGGDLQRELRRQRITAMLVPTMAVNHVVREDRESFSTLRLLHTGGDVILPSACRDLLSSSFRGHFHNLYGPTEGTTACTSYRVKTVLPDDTSVPIGAPLADAQIYVLDQNRYPVADGRTGELFVGGSGVARGYLGQPRLTAASFLPNPFHPGRMYATGDLARRREDGQLEFLGRIDDQVKVRGYRVEPREVERTLARLGGVLEVAVVAIGEGDGKHLVALVAGEEKMSLRKLREHATETMPEYMVPSAFAVVPKIPANDHGKRDTRQLADLARKELDRRRDTVPPRDAVESYLAKLWEELLDVEQVGVHDDFFALGGNSLLAFRVRRRVINDTGAPLDMQDVLSTTVLADLATIVRKRKASSGDHHF